MLYKRQTEGGDIDSAAGNFTVHLVHICGEPASNCIGTSVPMVLSNEKQQLEIIKKAGRVFGHQNNKGATLNILHRESGGKRGHTIITLQPEAKIFSSGVRLTLKRSGEFIMGLMLKPPNVSVISLLTRLLLCLMYLIAVFMLLKGIKSKRGCHKQLILDKNTENNCKLSQLNGKKLDEPR